MFGSINRLKRTYRKGRRWHKFRKNPVLRYAQVFHFNKSSTAIATHHALDATLYQKELHGIIEDDPCLMLQANLWDKKGGSLR